MSDDEIMEGLAEQHVVQIKRFTRKIPSKPEPVNTASLVLTFNLPKLPEKRCVPEHQRAAVHSTTDASTARNSATDRAHVHNWQYAVTVRKTAMAHRTNAKSNNAAEIIGTMIIIHHCYRKYKLFEKGSEIQRIKTVERVTIVEARQQFNGRYSHMNVSPLANVIQQRNHSSTSKPNIASKTITPEKL